MITLCESGPATFGQGGGRVECELLAGLPHDFHEFSTLVVDTKIGYGITKNWELGFGLKIN